ncbi:MAG TPA: transcription termination factor Rho [Thermoanaerobaculia bacterium]|nr:transcription termination factor Rho [Thermoanaerobaculia bacterium]
MTPEETKNRKRRRRRRRPNGNNAATPNPQGGNGSDAPPPPERTAQGSAAPQNRSRRRRSRHRRRGEGEPRFDSPRTVSGDQPALPEVVDEASGVLFIKANGTGFLVNPANNYIAQSINPIVPRNIIERYHLQAGLKMSGPARRAGNTIELVNPEMVEDMPLEVFRETRRPFSELISIDPIQCFKLETEPDRLSTRVLDLLAPIGRGQRCLVVAPPKAGKTTLLKDIAHGIEKNHPEVIVMVLLVDERPEEVTDIRRSVRGEVIASSSDETAENHIILAELVLERARRLVELKHDVVILCDSITRMSRAYNNEQRSSGRILTGGIDARTMEKPRKFFGSARCGEDWSSLTIIATALIDTGSRMDEVIFQEFKGTGNTEIVLDRGLFERRIFPAINIAQTGTRKEEKLLPLEWQPKIHTLRRALAGTDPMTAMKMLLEKMQKYPSNEAFLKSF